MTEGMIDGNDGEDAQCNEGRRIRVDDESKGVNAEEKFTNIGCRRMV